MKKSWMFKGLIALGCGVLMLGALTLPTEAGKDKKKETSQDGKQQEEKMETVTQNFHSFTMTTIDGEEKSLADYKGKVLLVVNVASKCGYTGQYEGLQALYEKYKDKDFMILGFPSNDFMGQEPKSEAEIKEFCSTKYGVTFDMFSKIHTKGSDIHPLYKWLTEDSGHPGAISWNFNKFLIGKDGTVLSRYNSGVKPESKELVDAIEAAF